MPDVYNPNDFEYRVSFAAHYISGGRPTTRHFDTCFEMADGDFVAAALIRRALAKPQGRLAINLPRYVCMSSALANFATTQHLTRRELANHAAKARAEWKADFERRYPRCSACRRQLPSDCTCAPTDPAEMHAAGAEKAAL